MRAAASLSLILLVGIAMALAPRGVRACRDSHTEELFRSVASMAGKIQRLEREMVFDEKLVSKLRSALLKLYSQLDLALAELYAGKYCSVCGHTRSEIEADGRESFADHLENVGGTEERAPQSLIDETRARYAVMIEDARDDLREAEREGERRRAEYWSARRAAVTAISDVRKSATVWADAIRSNYWSKVDALRERLADSKKGGVTAESIAEQARIVAKLADERFMLGRELHDHEVCKTELRRDLHEVLAGSGLEHLVPYYGGYDAIPAALHMLQGAVNLFSPLTGVEVESGDGHLQVKAELPLKKLVKWGTKKPGISPPEAPPTLNERGMDKMVEALTNITVTARVGSDWYKDKDMTRLIVRALGKDFKSPTPDLREAIAPESEEVP